MLTADWAAAFLALAEMPRSGPAGAAIFTALSQSQNAADRWIPDAATIAAVRHDSGFLKAVLASTSGSKEDVPAKPQPKAARMRSMLSFAILIISY